MFNDGRWLKRALLWNARGGRPARSCDFSAPPMTKAYKWKTILGRRRIPDGGSTRRAHSISCIRKTSSRFHPLCPKCGAPPQHTAAHSQKNKCTTPSPCINKRAEIMKASHLPMRSHMAAGSGNFFFLTLLLHACRQPI